MIGERDVIDFALHESYHQLLEIKDDMKLRLQEKENKFAELALCGQSSSFEEERELQLLRQEYGTVSRNIVFTHSDFMNDLFAKRLFDFMDIPVFGQHLPSLMIFDFMQLSDDDNDNQVKTYHFPAREPFGSRSQHLVITNPAVITNFVLDFFKGNLHPTLTNEDIDSSTFKNYPQQAQMFNQSMIKKINAKTLSELIKQPLEEYYQQKYLVIACEFYWAPCIDKFYQVQLYLEEKKQENSRTGKDHIEVYFFDMQHNDIYHRQFWKLLRQGFDTFGIFFKDPHAIARWEAIDESGMEAHSDSDIELKGGNPDEHKLLDRYINFTITDYNYFDQLYQAT